MKLFVTGGTGFIGSHFLRQALSAGHEVVALRRKSDSRTKFAIPKEPIWIEASLGKLDASLWSGVDVLVHLAAGGVTPQPATWESCYQVNVVDTLALVSSALDAGVRRVFVSGSYAEYGLAGLRYDLIPPDAPLEPTDPYAASKASSCVALAALCRARKFELAYYRLFSVYGDGQNAQNFWPQIRSAALSGADFDMTAGSQVRDFINVQDAVNILLEACSRADLKMGVPHIRNLASGEPITLRDFALRVWKESRARGKINFGAIPNRPNEVARYIPLLSDT
jgi:nucleoside-diphosphate-sugar epimerase